MRKTRFAILFSALAVLIALLTACGAPSVATGVDKVLEKDGETLKNFEAFLRVDNDSSTAWLGEIENLRIFAEGRYELGEAKEKYGLDTEYHVSTEGLDTLHASASAQFSVPQFEALADTLREVAGDKQIIIVDLREESHAFLNGASVSVFKLHNWGNLGLSLDKIEKDEKEYFHSLLGTEITAWVEDDEVKQEDKLVFTVNDVITEKELVENEGFTYFRLDCTDHAWPTAEEIDRFIAFVKEVGTEDTWFHFHCHAGKGRTGVFLTLYDAIKNPDVPMKDILYRHAMTNSNYPLYTGDPESYKAPLYEEKAEMTPLLFEYLEENGKNDFAVTFAKWLAEQD